VGSATYVSHATRDNERVVELTALPDADAPYFSMILVSRERA